VKECVPAPLVGFSRVRLAQLIDSIEFHETDVTPNRSSQPRNGRSVPFLLGLLVLLVLDGPETGAASQTRPIRTDLDEQVQARLLFERVRIEPAKGAEPGECRRLTPADLKVSVRDEAIPSDVVDLDRRWQPTLHALVLDTSASMIDDLAYVRHAARQYVQQLRPDTEKALIATFDDSVTLWEGATSNQGDLLESVDRIWIGGQTSMIDALYQILRELEGYHERPVLILLSDGADTCSRCALEDVAYVLPRRPEKTIFTIGIGLQKHGGEKPTRQLLQDLATATDGEFFDVDEGSDLAGVFDSIRDVLANEATISVVDPHPAEDPARIKVKSANKHCRVKVLKSKSRRSADNPDRKPIAKPYPELPQTVATPLTDTHRALYKSATERYLDAACDGVGLFQQAFGDYRQGPLWQFRAEAGRVSGCGFDSTLVHGPLFDPAADRFTSAHDGTVLTMRLLAFTVPAREDWPTAPEQVMDRLGDHALSVADAPTDAARTLSPVSHHARTFDDYPRLVEGSTFMELRPTLARLLFLYPEYRDFALAKLREHAEWDLTILTERYHRRYPKLPRDALAGAVRQTDEGQSILARAVEPSALDLQSYLAGWLGDISANELFVRWERNRINRFLEGEGTAEELDRFADAWQELRRVFFVPSYTRTLALLFPIFDVEDQRVGFWRVLLPRASLMQPRMADESGDGVLSRELLDLVPDLPLGMWFTRTVLAADAELAAFIDERDYRASIVTYELIGEPARHEPFTAYWRSRVRVLLQPSEANPPTDSGRLQLTAEVSLGVSWEDRPQPTLTGLAITAPDDDDLNRLGKRAQKSIVKRLTPDPEPEVPRGVTID
jgi:Mg-chelatase subunit ChlD